MTSLLDLLGASSEEEAIANLLGEREAMVSIKGDVDTLRIVVRRLVVVVEMSRRVCSALESEMFLDGKVRELVVKILEQCKLLEKYIEFSRSLK